MYIFTFLLAAPVWAVRRSTLGPGSGLCMAEPLMILDAGTSEVSAIINDDQAHRCEASLDFSNPEFLSLTYAFQSLNCSASQLMTFALPVDVPNGEAFVTWHCSGLTPLCYHANISGGLEQPAMQLQRTGMVGCVTEVVKTSTSFFTTTTSSGSWTASTVTTFTTTEVQFAAQTTMSLAPTTVVQTVSLAPTTVTQTIAATITGTNMIIDSPVNTSRLSSLTALEGTTSTGVTGDASAVLVSSLLQTPTTTILPTKVADSFPASTTNTNALLVTTSDVDHSSTLTINFHTPGTVSLQSAASSTGTSIIPVNQPSATVVKAASVFDTSSGCNLSPGFMTLSIVSTLTVFQTVKSCTISV